MFRTRDKTARRPAHGIIGILSVALLGVAGLSTQAQANPIDVTSRTDTRFYLSGLVSFQEYRGRSSTWHTLAATGELRFSSEARPYYASLFADYRISTDGRFIDNANVGALFRYNWHWWDATTYAFVNKTTGSDQQWLYAGRLRYRVAKDHKIGVESLGKFGHSRSPHLQLGYYNSISDSVSLNVFADPGWNRGVDFSARLELVWTIR